MDGKASGGADAAGVTHPVRVSISNFQSIKEIEFEIHGFTCVTGPTNIGKSAIIRALSGALLNSPVTDMVRRGEKFCTVTMESGTWGLKWEKAERGINRYWIPGDDKPKDKIGQGQTEITASLGFGSIEVGDEKLQPWYANQYRPVFLMDQSGPAVTDFISEVSRLKMLQDAITINVKNRSRMLAEAKLREEDLEKLRAEFDKLSGIDNVLTAEEDLVAQFESLRECGEVVRHMSSLRDGMDREEEAIRSLEPVESARVPQDRLGDEIASAAEAIGHLARLDAAARSIISLNGVKDVVRPGPGPEVGGLSEAASYLAIEEMESVLKVIGPVRGLKVPDGSDIDTHVAEVSRAWEMLSMIEAETEAISALGSGAPAPPEGPEPPSGLAAVAAILSDMEEARDALLAMDARLKSAVAEVAEVAAELAKIPTCPTCKQVMSGPRAHPAHA